MFTPVLLSFSLPRQPQIPSLGFNGPKRGGKWGYGDIKALQNINIPFIPDSIK